MKRGGGTHKGSSFERKICKALSLWWTHNERDDVFWRTSQSGGRATIRGRRGLRTHGQYGDVSAIDPIGAALVNLFTLELKAGYGKWDLLTLLSAKIPKNHPVPLFVAQAKKESKLAGTPRWMIIFKRNNTEPMVLVSRKTFYELEDHEMRLVNGKENKRIDPIIMVNKYVIFPFAIFLKLDPKFFSKTAWGLDEI